MNLDMSDAARDLLRRERLLLADLSTLLGRLDASSQELDEIRTALRDLEGLFLLVVCGEYNAGKSTFLNALLGAHVMPEGVTPTTDRITIVSHGDEERVTEERSFVVRREYPADILRDLALVDTPGTNAVIRQHQELTEGFIPRADLVLFVTSADRPFTESERRFLELIRSWGKKVVVVVNKIDILEPDEQRKVLAFVNEHAQETLDVNPKVFGVAARDAFRARRSGDDAALQKTGLRELERYIETALAAEERLKLKLGTPLGIAKRVSDTYQDIISERLTLLSDDRRTLDAADRQLKEFERDMHREFESYLARVKTVLLEVERRGEVFFDDMVRVQKVGSLLNSERIREMFEAQVIRGADRDIDKAVSEMVDWFIQRNLQLWEDVMAFVKERRKASREGVMGEIGGKFQYDRDTLIRSLSSSAETVLETYDENAEARRLANSLQGAVMQTGLIQVGGIGLGAAAVAFLSGAALDVTGVVAGLAVTGLGLLVLPRRRRVAKRNLHERMQELRDGLEDNLGAQFEDELRRATEKVNAAIRPYTRFVRSELGRLEELRDELARTQDEVERLAYEVDVLGGEASGEAGGSGPNDESVRPYRQRS